jgi:dTDP-4-dehydrorhamnose 3,5-epimerase
MSKEGMLPGAEKDSQSITKEWQFTGQRIIDGVAVKEITNVPKETGYLTEVYRREWALDEEDVDQVFQVALHPGGVSAWHVHAETIDRLMVNHGQVKVALYDAREGSPTHREVNVFRVGKLRPCLIVVPPGVWHGVKNLAPETSLVLNLVDRAYRYEDPDHYRLPRDTEEIPYRI